MPINVIVIVIIKAFITFAYCYHIINDVHGWFKDFNRKLNHFKITFQNETLVESCSAIIIILLLEL